MNAKDQIQLEQLCEAILGHVYDSKKKKYHPATLRAYKNLMLSLEENVDDVPPELLDKVIARINQAKANWE